MLLTRAEQEAIMRRVAKITSAAVRAATAMEKDRQINKPPNRHARMKAVEKAREELRDYLKEI